MSESGEGFAKRFDFEGDRLRDGGAIVLRAAGRGAKLSAVQDQGALRELDGATRVVGHQDEGPTLRALLREVE